MDILLVDDESLARERLRRLLSDIEDCSVVGEARNGEEALQQVERLDPDLILLDVRMPVLDGIDAGKTLAAMDNPPVIIYCTAYDDYALDAFSASATDYLLKPVRADKLSKALDKARQLNRIQQNSLDVVQEQTDSIENQRTHITAKSRRGVELIPIDNIRCFMADQKYVTVYHLEGETLIDEPLKELENEYPERFVRIHRNALIPLQFVEGLERTPEGSYCVRIDQLAFKPQISRRHVSQVKALLETL
ncbi:MAG: LytTR family DNA-binding domain-containing protein [Cellvibrionaceae bacterium]